MSTILTDGAASIPFTETALVGSLQSAGRSTGPVERRGEMSFHSPRQNQAIDGTHSVPCCKGWSALVRHWTPPIENNPDLADACCYRSRDVSRNWALDDMAGEILSRREFADWTRLRTPERRRREWLLGRLCAKEALQSLLVDKVEAFSGFHTIELLPDNHGRPVALVEWDGATKACRPVSIAHSGGVVAAIAMGSNDFRSVGIDLEPIVGDFRYLERMAFRGSERLLLAGRRACEKGVWLTRLWCAKEALAKALGRGMIGGPLSFVVADVEVTSGKATIRLEFRASDGLHEFQGKSFPVFTGHEDGLAYATSVLD